MINFLAFLEKNQFMTGVYYTVTEYCRKKFMKDIFTAEADSRMCCVSKDQKFHTNKTEKIFSLIGCARSDKP